VISREGRVEVHSHDNIHVTSEFIDSLYRIHSGWHRSGQGCLRKAEENLRWSGKQSESVPD
jgi:hypothetical protein